jgi:hypothetical protein
VSAAAVVAGAVIIVAPIAAVLLFGRDDRPRHVPLDENPQQEEVMFP